MKKNTIIINYANAMRTLNENAYTALEACDFTAFDAYGEAIRDVFHAIESLEDSMDWKSLCSYIMLITDYRVAMKHNLKHVGTYVWWLRGRLFN